MTPELEEKLGRAYCTLNKWGWDELCGPKPDGFDSMTNDEKARIFLQPCKPSN